MSVTPAGHSKLGFLLSLYVCLFSLSLEDLLSIIFLSNVRSFLMSGSHNSNQSVLFRISADIL